MIRNRVHAALVAFVPVIMLLFARADQSKSAIREIQVIAKRYAYDPPEITLKKGEPVTLVLRSEDVTHGILQPDLNIHAEMHKNRPVRVTVQPNVSGTFEARCSYFCGVGHGSMRLKFHVVE